MQQTIERQTDVCVRDEIVLLLGLDLIGLFFLWVFILGEETVVLCP